MFRLSTRADPGFLAEMLYEAVYWRDDGAEERPSLDALLTDPEFASSVQGWGREGDVAVLALDRGDEPVGAAWYRRHEGSNGGAASPRGFFASDIPIVCVGVYPEFRARGVSELLLGSLVVRARADGLKGLSTHVDRDDPMTRLFAKVGFEVAIGGGDDTTMVITFDE